MLLKRHIPLMIVIGVGLLTLFGHFINNAAIQNFVNNDATQWFDIIASFAVFLGALNMLKLQICLLYTSPSPRDGLLSRMPSSA